MIGIVVVVHRSGLYYVRLQLQDNQTIKWTRSEKEEFSNGDERTLDGQGNYTGKRYIPLNLNLSSISYPESYRIAFSASDVFYINHKRCNLVDDTQNSITLTRNKEDTKASLKINDTPVYEFIIDSNREDGNLTLRENSILTIWFNAWRYESEEHLALIPFMKVIAYAMGEHPIYKDIRPIILKALFILGKGVLAHYATQYIMTEKGAEEFEKNIANKLERSAEFEKDVLYFDGMRKIQEEIEKILRKYKDTRIVIFVDDLDRCDPEKALQVFESIKIFLDIKGFIFVLGLSKSALLKLIQIKLNKMGLDNTKAEEYIRKIIQVDITIKKWTSDAIKVLINNLLNKLDEDVRVKIKGGENSGNIELIKDIVELNPRQTKRLTNNLIISIAANKYLNITAFLVLEFLNKKWNIFYDNISDVRFLKFCKKGSEMTQNDREIYIAKFNRDLEEKAKQGLKLTDTERKIVASTEEFLDPTLWFFLEKYKNIIFAGISSDENEPTEEEISIAKDFQTAKVARESVAEVNPTEDKAAATDIDPELTYAMDYYNGLRKASTDLLEFLKALPKANLDNARMIFLDLQNAVDDLLMIYKYKKVPSINRIKSKGEISVPNVSAIYSEISRIMEEYKSMNTYSDSQLESIIENIRKSTKELMAYSMATLDELDNIFKAKNLSENYLILVEFPS